MILCIFYRFSYCLLVFLLVVLRLSDSSSFKSLSFKTLLMQNVVFRSSVGDGSRVRGSCCGGAHSAAAPAAGRGSWRFQELPRASTEASNLSSFLYFPQFSLIFLQIALNFLSFPLLFFLSFHCQSFQSLLGGVSQPSVLRQQPVVLLDHRGHLGQEGLQAAAFAPNRKSLKESTRSPWQHGKRLKN